MPNSFKVLFHKRIDKNILILIAIFASILWATTTKERKSSAACTGSSINLTIIGYKENNDQARDISLRFPNIDPNRTNLTAGCGRTGGVHFNLSIMGGSEELYVFLYIRRDVDDIFAFRMKNIASGTELPHNYYTSSQSEFGLKKIYPRRNGAPGYIYFVASQNGKVSDLIECPSGFPENVYGCSYYFDMGILKVNMVIPGRLIGQWRSVRSEVEKYINSVREFD